MTRYPPLSRCEHEIDEKTIVYDKRYGRTGRCVKCGIEICAMRINHKPKRTRPKMKKKERRKLNEELRNAEDGKK